MKKLMESILMFRNVQNQIKMKLPLIKESMVPNEPTVTYDLAAARLVKM